MWNLPTSKYVKAFEPQMNTLRSHKERSCSEDTQMTTSSEDDDEGNTTTTMLPEIIPVSSLASFSDSTVSSSGRVSPANSILSVSPSRSIFSNYWASPRGGCDSEGSQGPTASFEKASGGSKEKDLLYKLSSLSLPLVDDDEDDQSSSTTDCASKSLMRKSSSAQAAPSPKMVDTKSFRRPCVDDSTINYGRDKKRPDTSAPRRKILPTVVAPPSPTPPPAATNTHERERVALREQTQRPWSSTTALIKRPTHSCLRPSRYSCSMINERELAQQQHQDTSKEDASAAAAIAARAALSRSKSVSFYSQVSVFEFVKYGMGMEDVRPSKDWSKYFGS
eukprot:CAMPEP_0201717964 /NCGR_PEP_ID=MMETSP0593-20130828/3589_1 /ASSEMBLY_ACC=CAM_ASM_000672 /TAXON_ID=267983 /ORGANISM="Skeletonema japonicum, Strain CCMP2506" /LENGTH=334 /DNA_ID=CAMNT_0048208141 /DNA_START=282 /DNA_END=1286 /DNA_ORIENTATION=+